MHKSKKKLEKLEEFQDFDPTEQFPQRRISRTVGYQNSESIQEEDEEQQSSSMHIPKAKLPLMNSSIQQPCEYGGSDMKVPTIYTNSHLNRSIEKNLFNQQESRKQIVEDSSASRLIDVSALDVGVIIDRVSSKSDSSYLMSKNKSPTLNSQHIKSIITKFAKIIRKTKDLSKYKDITLIDEIAQIQPTYYRLITFTNFGLTSFIILISCIFIPLNIGYEQLTIFGYCVHIVCLLQIFTDLYLKRGPYKLKEGKFNFNYINTNSYIIDYIRIITTILLIIGYFDINNKEYVIIPFLIAQIIRQSEKFENIYVSTQFIVFIIIEWMALIFGFSCLMNNYELEYSIGLAISILTHSGSVIINLENSNESIIISIYMILTTLILVYTVSIMFIWIKPEIKLEEEKEKHLAGFLKEIRSKNIDYGLQCRSYSYLEFVIDEDLTKTRDMLAKKLSAALQEELQVCIRSKVVDKIKLFQRFSAGLRQELIYWFDLISYGPEDNIVQEHQLDDPGLYYILKGKVKIQFQGFYQGKPKRTFKILTEGQTFGEYSFISGNPPYISVNSQGVCSILKLRRSDFLEIIKKNKNDNENFCLLKDLQNNGNHKMFECYYCGSKGHLLFECQYLQYYPNKEKILEQYIYPHKQVRYKIERRHKQPKALTLLYIVNEQAKQFQQKLSQEIMTSEDIPMSSQLPYSENQTQQSASYLSKTQSIHKYSPDHMSESPNSHEDQTYEELSIDPVMNQQLRKQTNKTTLRTAGFPFMTDTLGNKKLVHSGHKDLQQNSKNLQVITEASQSKQYDSLNSKQEDQLSKQSNGSQVFKKNHLYTAARSMHAKLTFRYQQQQSNGAHDDVQFQHQAPTNQNSIRQTSNRSNTYSNPLSNNLSNNPSSNSKVNTKSAKVSPTQFQQQQHKKKEERGSYSDQSLSDQRRNTTRKKSTKTNTKVSILNQQSQFQILNSPENNNFYNYYHDMLHSRFEKMHLFQHYYPHNNYDCVIERTNRFKKIKKRTNNKYTIKCYVATKIKRVKRILEFQ